MSSPRKPPPPPMRTTASVKSTAPPSPIKPVSSPTHADSGIPKRSASISSTSSEARKRSNSVSSTSSRPPRRDSVSEQPKAQWKTVDNASDNKLRTILQGLKSGVCDKTTLEFRTSTAEDGETEYHLKSNCSCHPDRAATISVSRGALETAKDKFLRMLKEKKEKARRTVPEEAKWFNGSV